MTTVANSLKIKSGYPAYRILVLSFAGALLIAAGARIQVPTYPVPVTLQTFAVDLLLLANPYIAYSSALAYLMLASLGLPVLACGSNSLWLFGPTAGYLIGMPIGCLLLSRLGVKDKSASTKLGLLIIFHTLILTLGCCYLSAYTGLDLQKSVKLGFVSFLVPELVKIFAALTLSFKK